MFLAVKSNNYEYAYFDPFKFENNRENTLLSYVKKKVDSSFFNPG